MAANRDTREFTPSLGTENTGVDPITGNTGILFDSAKFEKMDMVVENEPMQVNQPSGSVEQLSVKSTNNGTSNQKILVVSVVVLTALVLGLIIFKR